ncbi:MAG: hypothetical protein ACYC26_10900 [Phycisphaerales bacterium]
MAIQGAAFFDDSPAQFQKPPERLELSTCVLQKRWLKSQTTENKQVKKRDDQNWASHWAFLTQTHPDLADVLQAWPKLPAAIRKGIMAMIDAAEDSA